MLKPSIATEPIIQSNGNVTFTLSGLTFTETKEAPAAVLLEGEEDAVTLTGDTFTDNKDNKRAGAVDIDQSKNTSGPTVITGNTFMDNSTQYDGGGIYFSGDGPAVIDDNTFSGNSAVWAGGLYVLDLETTSNPVQISGNTIGGPSVAAGNTASGRGGGAVVALGPGQPLSLAGNTFENNRITGKETAVEDREGAGLFLGLNYGSGPFPVTQAHNLFSDNAIDESAKSGSANLAAGGAGEWVNGLMVQSTGDTFKGNRIAVDDGAPPEGAGLGAIASKAESPEPAEPATFVGNDDLFLDNSIVAGGWGGGIYVGGPAPSCVTSCPGSSVTLNDSTVVSNTVEAGAGSEGGAIWGSPNDSLAVANSIIFGNSPQPEIFGFATTTPTFAYSDVCDEAGTAPLPGAGNICANPQLAENGEETASSPTIDAGSNALVPSGLTTDAFGTTRILAGHAVCAGEVPKVVDMGAAEFSPAIPPCAPLVTIGKSSPAPPRPGLTRFVSLKTSSTGVALRLSCSSTDGQGCSGKIYVTLNETLKGKKVVAVSAANRKEVPARIAEASFSLPAGGAATFPAKLNSTGLKLLRHFRAISAFVLANEASPTSTPFIFLLHTVRFIEPRKHKHRSKQQHSSPHSKRH